MRTITLFTLLFLVLFHSEAQVDDNLKQKIDSVITYYHQDGKFNGNILIAINGRVLLKKSYGLANLNEKTPLDSNSVFCLASLSKIFTSAAIFMLEKEGRLSIEDNVRDYIPELPEYFNPIKIKHLLSHTSGIPLDKRGWQAKIDTDNSDAIEFLISQKKLDFKPGKKYRYSNEGFILLATIIERVSGVKYHEFLENKVFAKAEMNQSFVRSKVPTDARTRIVNSYVNEKQADWPLFTYGPGGIYSTSGDLYKWDRAFFGYKIFDKETVEKILSPIVIGKKQQNYGYGWGTVTIYDKTYVGHTGGMFGFRNLYEKQLENKITIIILSNMGDSTPLIEIRNQIQNVFKNKILN